VVSDITDGLDPVLAWSVRNGENTYRMELTRLDAAVLWSLGHQVTRCEEEN
jgi:hypothetical protein